MNRLFEIATELGKIAHKRFELRQAIAHREDAIKRYKRTLIPAGGWPGKNADERKAAEVFAFDNDADLAEEELLAEVDREDMEKLDIDREALTAERDAITWTIRDNENVARGGESVFELMERIYSKEAPIKEMDS